MPYFVFTDSWNDTFVINLEDSDAIAHARALIAGTTTQNMAVGGMVTVGPVDYNIGWSYHVAPADVVFYEVSANGFGMQFIEDLVRGGLSPEQLSNYNFLPVDTRMVAELNEISGTAGTDILSGGSLPDIIFGNAGDDDISGGNGNDHLIGDAGNDYISGGSGADKISGGDGNDLILGDDGNDQLYGGAGSDSLFGGLGDDVLSAGGGTDTLDGGDGSDIYLVDNAAGHSATLIADYGSSGTDEIRFSSLIASTLTLSATDTGIERITIGTGVRSAAGRTGQIALNVDAGAMTNGVTIMGNWGANILTGTAFSDTIEGNLGNDTLDGGGGGDTLIGGSGNDRYIVESGDTIREWATDVEWNGYSYYGDDVVVARTNYTLGDQVSVETMTTINASATTAINLTGNEFGQSLYGNEGANSLNGGGGNDYLVGLGGNDFLIGGEGNDNLAGGTGNDIYYADGGDRVIEGAGEGDDLVVAFESFALGAGSSVETMAAAEVSGPINLTGNDLGQSLYGNAGANVLNGGGGNDFLVGGDGADRFVFAGSPGNDGIGDFVSGTDKIDLSAYGITAAQVSSSTSGGNTLLSIDSNVDGSADFTISLIGVAGLTTTDFIF